MRETLLFPLDVIKPGEIISRYSDWIYFALILVFFIAISGLVLRRHFESPYVKPLIITVGLILAVTVFRNRQLLNRIFDGWGALGSIMLVLMSAFIPFALARGFGMSSSRAFWLTYDLVYILAWVHAPGMFHTINQRGLGLISLILMVLFLVGLWKVLRLQKLNGFTQRQSPAELKSWLGQENPGAAEIEQESNQEKEEQKELVQRAVPNTVKDYRSVDQIEKALSGIEQIISKRGNSLSLDDKHKIVRLLEAALGNERVFKTNLARLHRIFKQTRILDASQIKEMQKRYRKANKKERAILKQEHNREMEKVTIYQSVADLESKLLRSIQIFDRYLGAAVQALKSGASPVGSMSDLYLARKTLKNIKTILLSMRDLERRLVHIIKEDRGLLAQEKKAA